VGKRRAAQFYMAFFGHCFLTIMDGGEVSGYGSKIST
jgi:hypothetical protein